MVRSLGAKFKIKPNFGSRDMGPSGTPKRLFRLFLKKFVLDFAKFLSEWGSCGTHCVC